MDYDTEMKSTAFAERSDNGEACVLPDGTRITVGAVRFHFSGVLSSLNMFGTGLSEVVIGFHMSA